MKNEGEDFFGGSALISTRDTPWKIFTPTMLNWLPPEGLQLVKILWCGGD